MLEKLPSAVGRALRRVRPGLGRLVCHGDALLPAQPVIEVMSPAFGDHQRMPARYTADGDGVSPPLRWTNVPDGTRSVALLVEDADSPTPAPLVHAIAWRLPPALVQLSEGELTVGAHHPALGTNSYLRAGWLPPDPPPGHGAHRYGFQIFALDHDPDLGPQPGRRALVEALRGHTLARGLLIGLYER
jgi:Raf kinase inhibitor-like YbhB/YbcL family protein